VRLQVVPLTRGLSRGVREGLLEVIVEAAESVPPSAAQTGVNMGAMSEQEAMISRRRAISPPQRHPKARHYLASAPPWPLPRWLAHH